MAPAVQKKSKKTANKKQLKPAASKKVKKFNGKFVEKKQKGNGKKALKELSDSEPEEEDSPMEDIVDSDDNDDIFKKLQSVMDEDDSEAEEDEDQVNESDSDLPSEFEREMAVDSDNDDDEEENAGKLNKDISQHKKELEELKKRDPEFYKFLEKEDQGLLDFDESDQEEKDDDEEEYSDMEDPEEAVQESVPVLDKATLNQWIDTVKSNHDFKTFKKLLSAFKTAARMSEEDDSITFTVKIEDPAVFSKVIISTLRLAPVVFGHHLKPKKENGSPLTSSKWSFFKSYVKSYLNNLIHLLQNLTDADMLRMTIREAEKVTNLYVCFDRLAKEYLKTLLNAWSNAGSTDTVRVQAFLSIKSLAVIPVHASKETNGKGYLDLCLKNVYLTFVKHCKNTSLHTLPIINLMRNLAIQLYGINPVLSYQQAFVYIRQLAIHLRQAMKVRSTKNHNMVYNWQYVHCIDFWADVLNAYSGPMVDKETEQEVESPLKALIYPLTQVAIGVIQLIPTAQYYPLRFHVLRCLTSMVHHTGVYVPLATFVLEVLDSSIGMEKAKKTNSGTPLDWDLVLKVPIKNVHSRMYQDEVLDQCAKALKTYYKEYCHHISFPEMVDADIVTIKRFTKKSKSIKGKGKLVTLAKELEAKANFVRQQRTKISFSPVSQDQIAQFNKDMKAKLT
ncbi:Noc2p family-domain-containing protein [Gilbertella persicaria]|uniref:Noc2p family-domain-containing protein n=1 Tax=Gilbertella persicaria TaxID=101096 RepID=UPI002220DC62|nr:Noc2p family-domain-containing protein [Gilbertella persicaria]KAI8077961.1 Noc2p family-domain-containing protein [Gilbertella persicaria]